MRTVLPVLLFTATGWAGEFGTWKMNPARSKFLVGSHPRSATVRIEPHVKGEVFTYDRVTSDGQAVTISTILYLDGKQRSGQPQICSGGSGIQSSRRLDDGSVEFSTQCKNGRWGRFVHRLTPGSRDLIFEMTQGEPKGLRIERQLVLEEVLP